MRDVEMVISSIALGKGLRLSLADARLEHECVISLFKKKVRNEENKRFFATG